MAPRITVITHNHLRDAGYAPRALARAGARVTQWDMHSRRQVPARDSFDGLVVLGGPMRASERQAFPWLDDELELMAEVFAGQTPILGVCLGAQMLCQIAGGSVTAAAHEERQFTYMRIIADDPLVHGLPRLLPLYTMHSDTMVLPAAAQQFMVGGWCPQGVRFSPHAWGLQFHPEATFGLVRYWHRRLEPQLRALGSSPLAQDLHYLRHAKRQARASRRLWANFVRQVNIAQST